MLLCVCVCVFLKVEDKQQLQCRSYTICGSNPRKDLESSLQTSISSPNSNNTPEREVVCDQDSRRGMTGDVMADSGCGMTGDNHVGVEGEYFSRDSGEAMHSSTGQASMNGKSQRPVLHIHATGQDRSRSATPTPAISIQPDQYEWTSGVLSGTQSEIVTSDTSLAKARGSTTTTAGALVVSDDDDSLYGAEERDEEDEENVFQRESPDGAIMTQHSVEVGHDEQLEEGEEGVHQLAQRQASPVDTEEVCVCVHACVSVYVCVCVRERVCVQ